MNLQLSNNFSRKGIIALVKWPSKPELASREKSITTTRQKNTKDASVTQHHNFTTNHPSIERLPYKGFSKKELALQDRSIIIFEEILKLPVITRIREIRDFLSNHDFSQKPMNEKWEKTLEKSKGVFNIPFWCQSEEVICKNLEELRTDLKALAQQKDIDLSDKKVLSNYANKFYSDEFTFAKFNFEKFNYSISNQINCQAEFQKDFRLLTKDLRNNLSSLKIISTDNHSSSKKVTTTNPFNFVRNFQQILYRSKFNIRRVTLKRAGLYAARTITNIIAYHLVSPVQIYAASMDIIKNIPKSINYLAHPKKIQHTSNFKAYPLHYLNGISRAMDTVKVLGDGIWTLSFPFAIAFPVMFIPVGVGGAIFLTAATVKGTSKLMSLALERSIANDIRFRKNEHGEKIDLFEKNIQTLKNWATNPSIEKPSKEEIINLYKDTKNIVSLYSSMAEKHFNSLGQTTSQCFEYLYWAVDLFAIGLAIGYGPNEIVSFGKSLDTYIWEQLHLPTLLNTRDWGLTVKEMILCDLITVGSYVPHDDVINEFESHHTMSRTINRMKNTINWQLTSWAALALEKSSKSLEN